MSNTFLVYYVVPSTKKRFSKKDFANRVRVREFDTMAEAESFAETLDCIYKIRKESDR